mmetsp:Transcript_2801/g.6263  ORF Transcript_2801/g.6263 Transcript_2801/m.6263 type:complete len:547 (-) Transcript_2801:36-1676(-)
MSTVTMSADEIYSKCHDEKDQDAQLKCIIKQLVDQDQEDGNYTSRTFLVYSAALVFFMQAGFAMICAGSVRKKNVGNSMLKNLLDACGAAVAYFCFGYAFAFGDGSNPNGFIGTTNFFLMDVDNYAFWMFEYAFSAASATIVAGTLAERCQMAAYLCYSFVLAGFVYPVVSHAIWSPHGFLSSNVAREDKLFGSGVVDFAGGGVVHLVGGCTALFATMILGPRRGRFHDDEGRKLDKPITFPGHSIALQMLGCFILWFGWYGFNSGSALIATSNERGKLVALSAVNTTLSGGTAGLVALFVNLFVLERRLGEPIFDLRMAMNGSLSGLVAITAGCGVVEPWAAMLIGGIAGLLYIGGSNLLLKLRLDDAVDAIPVHMVNGMWGLIAVGFLACPRYLNMTYGKEIAHVGWFYSLGRGSSDARLLAAQIVAILFILGWCLGIMMPFFIWLDWKGWFRSDPLEEIVGLDTSYHGGLILMSGDDSVNPEYVSQFKKERNDLRRRTTRSKRNLYENANVVNENATNVVVDEELMEDCKNSATAATSQENSS